MFRATDFEDLTTTWIEGHACAVRDIGVWSALQLDYGWRSDPESTVVVACHETLGCVGGVRLQVRGIDRPLAIERAIGALDPTFHVMAELLDDGVGEICGLWVAPRFQGHGLHRLLILAAVAVASQLPIVHLLGFAAEYTLPNLLDLGFSRIRRVGRPGVFAYPVPSIRSHVMVLHDLNTLGGSTEGTRRAILGLRRRPVQETLLELKTTRLHVRYALGRDEAALHVPAHLSSATEAGAHAAAEGRAEEACLTSEGSKPVEGAVLDTWGPHDPAQIVEAGAEHVARLRVVQGRPAG